MSARAEKTSLPLASWFRSIDRSLLYFYGGHIDGKFECSPTAAARKISVTEGYARERVRILLRADLLEQINTHKGYRISDRGLQYVQGCINKEELEMLNPTIGDHSQELDG